MKFMFSLLIGTFILALALTGCGPDDPPIEPPIEPPPPVETELPTLTPKELQAVGTWVFREGIRWIDDNPGESLDWVTGSLVLNHDKNLSWRMNLTYSNGETELILGEKWAKGDDKLHLIDHGWPNPFTFNILTSADGKASLRTHTGNEDWEIQIVWVKA